MIMANRERPQIPGPWQSLVMGVVAVVLVGAALYWIHDNDALDPAAFSGQSDAGYPPMAWSELLPKEWDPAQMLRGQPVGKLNDFDPDAVALARQMRETWDNAPTRGALDGARVALRGYLVPLEANKGEVRDFLLVPYFGACIHVPPPPANQIVHISLDTPMKNVRTMDSVQVIGTLRTSRQNSHMGVSGYSMEAVRVERYSSGRSFWSDLASRSR